MLFLLYPELFLEPLGNGCLVDMQEQVSLLVQMHKGSGTMCNFFLIYLVR